MTVLHENVAYRKALLGLGPVQKSTGTLAATTVALFTVAGGEVLVTAMWGRVTTSITVANSYYLQHNPTTGDTAQLSIGQVEHVSAGTDGVILWNVMWVPLVDGATLVAA